MLLTNRKKNLVAAFIILLSVLTGSCMYDKEELLYPGSNPPVSCSATPATFSENVLPLITTKCAIPGCHDATASGGHIFQTYNSISSAKDDINTQAIIQKTMPPTGPLSPTEINTLKCWIENGALNN